jgi:hypothetical protein
LPNFSEFSMRNGEMPFVCIKNFGRRIHMGVFSLTEAPRHGG